jgi:hypothetical protein
MKLTKTTSLAKVAKKVSFGGDSVAGNSGGRPDNANGWLTKGADNIAAQVEKVRLSAGRKFAPEVFIKDGESKVLRFRTDEPIGLLRRYQVKINGKWQSVTAPAEGTPDPLREAGLKPALRALYEVIDVDGYTDKKGKQHRMEARFFVANIKVHEQLETIRKKKGGLSKFNIEVSRSGSGTSTTYTLLPEDPGPLAGADRVQSIRKDVPNYYAPPPIAELRALANRFEPDDES